MKLSKNARLAVATACGVAATVIAAILVWSMMRPDMPVSDGTFNPGTGTVVKAVVVRVIDGDTAVFSLEDGSQEKVRFIGVDAPESSGRIEYYGIQAAAYTYEVLTKGRPVYLEQDVEPRDKYARLLAYVWLAEPEGSGDAEIRDKMFNAQLLLDGYAQQMTVQPNSKYAEYFTEYARQAREADRGLWDAKLVGEAGYVRPTTQTVTSKDDGLPEVVYVGNRRSHKFHYPGCESVAEMKLTNKVPLASREAAIEGEFIPCGKCDP